MDFGGSLRPIGWIRGFRLQGCWITIEQRGRDEMNLETYSNIQNQNQEAASDYSAILTVSSICKDVEIGNNWDEMH